MHDSMFRRGAAWLSLAAIVLGALEGCGSKQEVGIEEALGRPLAPAAANGDAAAADRPILGSGPVPGAPASAPAAPTQ